MYPVPVLPTLPETGAPLTAISLLGVGLLLAGVVLIRAAVHRYSRSKS